MQKVAQLAAFLAVDQPDILGLVEVTGASGIVSASGLSWKQVGRERPLVGRELLHPELAAAIATSCQVPAETWERIGERGLKMDHFIQVGGRYYQPAQRDGGYQWVRVTNST